MERGAAGERGDNIPQEFGKTTREVGASLGSVASLPGSEKNPSEGLGKSVADIAPHASEEAVVAAEKRGGVFSKNTIDIIKRDLGSNAVMNYSKINFTEMLVATGFDLKFAVTHWRLSKIIDGIILCAREFKICNSSVSHDEIPNKIYSQLKKTGGVSEPYWRVELVVPGSNPPEKKSKECRPV
jgi:hypothetical protein